MTVTKMSQFYFESYQSTSIRTIVSYLHSHYSTRPLICTVYNFTKFDIIFLAILPIPESFQKASCSFEECLLKFPFALLNRIGWIPKNSASYVDCSLFQSHITFPIP